MRGANDDADRAWTIARGLLGALLFAAHANDGPGLELWLPTANRVMDYRDGTASPILAEVALLCVGASDELLQQLDYGRLTFEAASAAGAAIQRLRASDRVRLIAAVFLLVSRTASARRKLQPSEEADDGVTRLLSLLDPKREGVRAMSWVMKHGA